MGSSRQRPTDTRKTKAPNRTTNSTANTSAVSPSYPWGRPTLPLPDVMSHNYMSRPSISPRTLPTTLMPRLTQVYRHEGRVRRARPVIERRATRRTCHTEKPTAVPYSTRLVPRRKHIGAQGTARRETRRVNRSWPPIAHKAPRLALLLRHRMPRSMWQRASGPSRPARSDHKSWA